jgi:hypothetical protein
MPQNGHDQNRNQHQNKREASHDEKRRAEPIETQLLEPVDDGVQQIAESDTGHERQKHPAEKPQQSNE